jgi:hypothetical protein
MVALVLSARCLALFALAVTFTPLFSPVGINAYICRKNMITDHYVIDRCPPQPVADSWIRYSDVAVVERQRERGD